MDDDRIKLEQIREHFENLTSWETEFMKTCSRFIDGGRDLTEKMQPIFDRIYQERVIEGQAAGDDVPF